MSEERKKEERLTKVNTKQTEIIEQISLSKERIFEKQRMYYELATANLWDKFNWKKMNEYYAKAFI